jgi:Ser/Thr protein kinase RdoA (MazF antagonist)
MHREELILTDDDIVGVINKNYDFKIESISFMDKGSFFAFSAETNKNKLFIKIYPRSYSLSADYTFTETKLNTIGKTLTQLMSEHGLKNIPKVYANIQGKFCTPYDNYFLMVFDYLAGKSPSYEPNELNAEKLQDVLSILHGVPLGGFSQLMREDFSINYALCLINWIEKSKNLHAESTPLNKMLCRIKNEQAYLQQLIDQLKTLQKNVCAKENKFVVTHGDPHHFNIIQNNNDLFLVDWDDIKLAPRERDIWFYKNNSVDQELCQFYQLQRFLNDLVDYLESVSLLERKLKQQTTDAQAFLDHWGWKIQSKLI